MPRGLIPSFTHRAWWWVFALFIATPGAVLTGKDAFEVWALENFLPAASTKR